MQSLLRNVRFYVLTAAIAGAVAVYVWMLLALPPGSVRTARLAQTYALVAVSLLYLALLVTPLTEAFPHLPLKGQLVQARRALGVSAVLFALGHAYHAFFGELGGFASLPFLDSRHLLAVSFSGLALLILLLLAATSFDYMMRRLGPNWKRLHRWVYLAGTLVVLHALMVGSHYVDPSSPWYRFSFLAFAFLMMLQALRVDRWLHRRYLNQAGFGPVSLLMAGSLVVGLATFSQPSNPLAVHQHGMGGATSQTVHYHANFAVFLDGQASDFSLAKYMEPVQLCSVGHASQVTPQQRVHLHEGVGVLVHVHSANVTWGDLFANLGWAVSDRAIVTDAGTAHVADAGRAVTAILNGQPVTDVASRFIRSEDRLLLSYGSEAADELQKRFADIPSTAVEANATTDPATCSGTQ